MGGVHRESARAGCGSRNNSRLDRTQPQIVLMPQSSKGDTLFLRLARAVIFLSVATLPISGVDGLQCYECLSLECPSGAVCESIKRTMLAVFVPKGHIIHFNPTDPCPPYTEPTNSSKWAELSKECQRSDSVCIVSPIEIISILDGSRGGKRLEQASSLTTTGFLRGCASRRKLQENEPTIRVHVNLLQVSPHSRRNLSSTESSSSTSGFGQPSQDLEMELDLSQLKFEDGYEIGRVHSHEFFLDQGTSNATKCLEDRCNTKVRFRSGGSREGYGIILVISSLFLVSRVW